MNKHQQFKSECNSEIEAISRCSSVAKLTSDWIKEVNLFKYSYHFDWQGRPIIQYPQDIIAMQEIIWQVKPDLIIETGIAHGGSLIFSASMLALLDITDAIESKIMIDPRCSNRKVVGVDIDIRKHNRKAIEDHAMSSRIQMIEGSSINKEVVDQVYKIASNYQKILVCLDSNHSHFHVLEELKAYANLTSIGSYCVVFDTIVEDLPENISNNRPWGPGNSPKTAVLDYLKINNNFEVDKKIENKLLITVAKDGYLKRVR